MDTQTTTPTHFNRLVNAIEQGVLWTLGAHDLMATDREENGLTFKARILPFNKDGKRATRPVTMRVTIAANDRDLYDFAVIYARGMDLFDHLTLTDVPLADVNAFLFALDFDGVDVLNPRKAPALPNTSGTVPCYDVMANVGTAKHVVNYHDGVKTHKDGSAFFDLSLPGTRAKRDAFIAELRTKGYRYGRR